MKSKKMIKSQEIELFKYACGMADIGVSDYEAEMFVLLHDIILKKKEKTTMLDICKIKDVVLAKHTITPPPIDETQIKSVTAAILLKRLFRNITRVDSKFMLNNKKEVFHYYSKSKMILIKDTKSEDWQNIIKYEPNSSKLSIIIATIAEELFNIKVAKVNYA